MKDVVLLHCCCAPCCCAVIESLIQNDIAVHLYFFNPNIHPEDEYVRRKQELMAYASYRGVHCIDADYAVSDWFKAVEGYEKEPERGKRCDVCISMRLYKTAQYAQEHGYTVFATSLAMSSQKRMDQIEEAGSRAVAAFPGISFLNQCWRRGGTVLLKEKIVKERQMYRQTYCGCLYSQTPRTALNIIL